jgi:N6-L-threonylcarbamoyladenine synthase
VVREALGEAETRLEEIDRVAVTRGPGLIGALLVGLAAAKGIAWGRGLPLVPVDHLHGHVASLYLQPTDLEPPFLCLLASGGHTLLDVQDRAGFRWSARPSTTRRGGVRQGSACSGSAIRAARRSTGSRGGRSCRLRLPGRPCSGARFLVLRSQDGALPRPRSPGGGVERRRADLAASYQRAIVRALVERTEQAVEEPGAVKVAIVGGVAANSELRSALPEATAAPLEPAPTMPP